MREEQLEPEGLDPNLKDISLDTVIQTGPDNFLLNADYQVRTYELFFDFEMTGIHNQTTPISLGIISDTGKEFYAEFTDFDVTQVDSWISENVIANTRWLCLGESRPDRFVAASEHDTIMLGTKEEVRRVLTYWLKDNFNTHYSIEGDLANRIEFIGDCCAYDWMLMTDLLGEYQTEEIHLMDLAFMPDKIDFKDKDKLKDWLRTAGAQFVKPGTRKVGLPKYPVGVNYIPTDLCTMFKDRGIDPDIDREVFAGDTIIATELPKPKHNALWDAKVIKANYNKLKSLDIGIARDRVAAAENLASFSCDLYQDSKGNLYKITMELIQEVEEE